LEGWGSTIELRPRRVKTSLECKRPPVWEAVG
jgi:hypothetical protein